MNFSAIVQLPQGQAPVLTSAGIKKLCQPVRQQLPLQFRVVSTTVKKDFVVYNCGVSGVTTNRSWRVSYRYSDFAAFSKKVVDHCTCKNDKCSGSCETIREILWAWFPKKRLPVLSRSAHTIADRANKFETVVQYLLRCILLPGSAMKCLHLRRNLPTNLFQFLGVREAADKRSVLQVFVDNCQGVSPKCGEPALRDSSHSDVSTVDSIEATDCAICLESVDLDQNGEGFCDDPDSSIVLPCQHAFHRECIFEWLLFQFHCPVCRARVGPPAAISYCRERNYKFQWWLSDFEENPIIAKKAEMCAQ